MTDLKKTFAVKIKPSGYTLHVEEGETVLDAALRQGFDFPYSCRSATCATCMGKVVKGNVSYGEFEPYALDEAEQEQGLTLFCTAQPISDLVIELDDVYGPEYQPPRTLVCTVTADEALNDDMSKLQLTPKDHLNLKYCAGQYVHVLCQDGLPIPYSIANAPVEGNSEIELHIRHADYDHVREILDKAARNEEISIKGPYGKVIYHPEAKLPLILVAGGTGFVPLKAIIEASLMNPNDKRNIYLYWGTQAPGQHYAHELAERWAENVPRFHYIPVVESNTNGDWLGRTGLVHEAVLNEHPDLNNFQAYASGPKDMVFAARDAFIAKGLKPQNIFSDTFELFEEDNG